MGFDAESFSSAQLAIDKCRDLFGFHVPISCSVSDHVLTGRTSDDTDRWYQIAHYAVS